MVGRVVFWALESGVFSSGVGPPYWANGSFKISYPGKRPEAASVESLPDDTAICAAFAPLAAAILRNLDIPHRLATGEEHVYVALPSEKVVFEATAPSLERGGWAPIVLSGAEAPIPETPDNLPVSFRTISGTTYKLFYVEGSPRLEPLSCDPKHQRRYMNIQAVQKLDAQKLVW